MSIIKLDPAGSVTIDDKVYNLCVGRISCSGPVTGTKVVFAIIGETTPTAYEYTEFRDANNNPFASRADLEAYLNANFRRASGVTSAKLDAKIQNKTQAEYDALSTQDKNNGTLYLIPKT